MKTDARQPVIIDASGEILGRLAVKIANVLRGKDKPTFRPHIVSGTPVKVINADKIRVTGRKLQQKIYYRHSGWPRGLKSKSLEERMASEPEQVIVDAVKGMLPKNRLRDDWLKMLTVEKSQSKE